MMFEYKGGKGKGRGGEECGKKWLRYKWMLPNNVIRKLLSN